MSSSTDKNGNVTEWQHAISVDRNGKTTEESSCKGTGCSMPNPEGSGGCTTTQCREFMAWLDAMSPMTRIMHDRFVTSKYDGLRGDQAGGGPGSSGGRQGGTLPTPVDGALDPNPEKGSSGGSGSSGAIAPTTPRLDVKKSLTDPDVAGQPGRTTPQLPPGTLTPDTPGGGGQGETGGGTGGGTPTPR
jgi:hypothetical protein